MRSGGGMGVSGNIQEQAAAGSGRQSGEKFVFGQRAQLQDLDSGLALALSLN